MEALDGVLRSAVRALQWYSTVRQGGADLDDGAMIAWKHAFQGDHRRVDVAEVVDLRDPFVLLRLDVSEFGEHRREGDVDLDVDGTERVFNA